MPDKTVFRNGPTVCAVGKQYHIAVPVKTKVLMSVIVNGKEYFNHSNGIRISDTAVQCFRVPMSELNSAKKYTITYEVILKREPYSCSKLPKQTVDFTFKPIEKEDDIHIYHISDTHGMKNAPVKAGSYFGKELDLLILNGDISSSSQTQNDILLTYDIAYGITKGEIPCIISRGNHDLRGKLAEKSECFLPTSNGKTYYTVTLGALWFCLLDLGEDKEDSHKEYSGTVACHCFREEESEFLKAVIDNKGNEYLADTVRYPIILSHVPFCHNNTEEEKGETPFNIEVPLLTDWCKRIKENIQPKFLLAGHHHDICVYEKGSPFDNKHLDCPVIIGSKPVKNVKNEDFYGCGITIKNDYAHIEFNDAAHRILHEHDIEF